MMQAIKAYGNAAFDNQIDAADPHKLIAMLYEGAVIAIERARMHLDRGEIAPRCEAISRAVSIIDQGLAASVDEEAGGDIAKNLLMLYGYMTHRLVLANANGDRAILDEVHGLLVDLKGAWEQIRP